MRAKHLRVIRQMVAASTQEQMAHRANFWLSLLHSVLNLATGILGILVLFGQTQTIHGWDQPSTLALMGIFLTVSSVRALVISPSLDALAGLEGDIASGRFDYALLRPLDPQFLASLRHWRPLALVDLGFGLAVIAVACRRLPASPSGPQVAAFLLALCAAVLVVYAASLAFASLVFWSRDFLFTWLFDALFQMARYPVGIYPGWLRLLLTWVIPVGIVTTVPAQALTGRLSPAVLAGTVLLALTLLGVATMLFRLGLCRYTSASS